MTGLNRDRLAVGVVLWLVTMLFLGLLLKNSLKKYDWVPKYYEIRVGMTLEEVERLLERNQSHRDVAGATIGIIFGEGGSIYLTFDSEGRVTTKSLRMPTNYNK